MTFNYTAKQYSGWLETPTGVATHYWFLESQTNPSKDPIILWLNGGPGWSSLVGMFTEIGPFFPNPDGKTLRENVYAWNKLASILFLESPRGVGFSYSLNTTLPEYNDDQTDTENLDALKAFFVRFPQFSGRDFYIAGESYAAVYITTLAKAFIQSVRTSPEQLPVNMKGIAIGNGALSRVQQENSFVNLAFYRGIIGLDDFEFLHRNCCQSISVDVPPQYCNFSSYLVHGPHWPTQPDKNGEPLHDACAAKIWDIIYNDLWNIKGYDPYNTNQDCYASDYSSAATNVIADFLQLRGGTNVKSTDPHAGFPCYAQNALKVYLNQPEVREAVHVPVVLKDKVWTKSSSLNYTSQNLDTTPIFNWILEQDYPLKVLIFNGDTDGVCNFLGAEWFVEALGLRVVEERAPWTHQQYDAQPVTAGFLKRFASRRLTVDLLTFRGAGHLVPQDQPLKALQMISNFMTEKRNYSDPLDSNIYLPLPLLQTQQANAAQSRSLLSAAILPPVIDVGPSALNPDHIQNLPGLAFKPRFNHYSGFLRGAEQSAHLRYWLVESEGNPDLDPLLLWINDGSGCSSMTAVFSGIGPFRLDQEGRVVSENVFAWNKAASLLFLEPSAVGSFTGNLSRQNNDGEGTFLYDTTAALDHFLSTYPQYKRRDFYVGGEAESALSVIELAHLLAHQIPQTGIPLKFKGFTVNSGRNIKNWHSATGVDNLYFHGVLGKTVWDSYRKCCDPQGELYCNVSTYILNPDGSDCSLLVNGMLSNSSIARSRDSNMYQNCKRSSRVTTTGLARMRREKAQADLPHLDFSSDAGYECFGTDVVGAYVNRPDVRRVLRVPDHFPTWQPCDFESKAAKKKEDMTSMLQNVLESEYVQELDEPFRVLVYNGDSDWTGGHIAAEFFVDSLARMKQANASARSPWRYLLPGETDPNVARVAGFQRTYDFGRKLSLDLLTVKGAGRLIATDRPGPALQMFANFLTSERNFSTPLSPSLWTVPAYGSKRASDEKTQLLRENPATESITLAIVLGVVAIIIALMATAVTLIWYHRRRRAMQRRASRRRRSHFQKIALSVGNKPSAPASKRRQTIV
ncbi:Protein K10C2.1 [Aphelenchoides avenae]|nr:Protein K10C2.1 [Aphelenchus avenae]